MSADFEDQPPVNCSKCDAEVHWLAVFPGGVCVECHAAAQAGRSTSEMWNEMMGTWKGGAVS